MVVEARQRIQPFEEQHLEAIAKVLADTEEGLSGSQIGHLLEAISVDDPTPNMTKWKRLFNAFVEFQNRHQVGNHVVKFITSAMHPASYTTEPQVFENRKNELNGILALCGMELRADGKVYSVAKAKSLDEALERANRLQTELRRRQVHPDVIEFCTAEILAKNYFHLVFEAMKSVTDKIRSLSGLTSDGADLADKAFSLGKSKQPLLAVNALDTDTLVNEQRGFVNLLKGIYGMIRSPLAHEAKIHWDVSEQDAVDILTMVSLIHRKLDKAYQYKA